MTTITDIITDHTVTTHEDRDHVILVQPPVHNRELSSCWRF
jgi:hypothetical protein